MTVQQPSREGGNTPTLTAGSTDRPLEQAAHPVECLQLVGAAMDDGHDGDKQEDRSSRPSHSDQQSSSLQPICGHELDGITTASGATGADSGHLYAVGNHESGKELTCCTNYLVVETFKLPESCWP